MRLSELALLTLAVASASAAGATGGDPAPAVARVHLEEPGAILITGPSHERRVAIRPPDEGASRGVRSFRPSRRAAGRASGASTIDLLVVYTQRAWQEAGGREVMGERITEAVDGVNSIFLESGVQMQVRLSPPEKIGYREAGRDENPLKNLYDDLDHLTNRKDGVLDRVQQLRAEARADFVILVRSSLDEYCGLAWWPRRVVPGRARLAYSVLGARCLDSGTLVAWALGTNMSLHPHREDYPRKPYYRFAHAYRDPEGLFRTLMAKACEGCGPRIPRFSNPDLFYEGRPTGNAKGDPGWSNNARALNRVRRLAADFDRFPCVADPDASCRGE